MASTSAAEAGGFFTVTGAAVGAVVAAAAVVGTAGGLVGWDAALVGWAAGAVVGAGVADGPHATISKAAAAINRNRLLRMIFLLLKRKRFQIERVFGRAFRCARHHLLCLCSDAGNLSRFGRR